MIYFRYAFSKITTSHRKTIFMVIAAFGRSLIAILIQVLMALLDLLPSPLPEISSPEGGNTDLDSRASTPRIVSPVQSPSVEVIPSPTRSIASTSSARSRSSNTNSNSSSSASSSSSGTASSRETSSDGRARSRSPINSTRRFSCKGRGKLGKSVANTVLVGNAGPSGVGTKSVYTSTGSDRLLGFGRGRSQCNLKGGLGVSVAMANMGTQARPDVKHSQTQSPDRVELEPLLKNSIASLLKHINWLTNVVNVELDEVRNLDSYIILSAQLEAHNLEVQKGILRDVRRWRHSRDKKVEFSIREFIHQTFIPVIEMFESERAMAQNRGGVDHEDLVWVKTRLRRFIVELWGLCNMSAELFL